MPVFFVEGKVLFFSHVPKAGGSTILRHFLELGNVGLVDWDSYNGKTDLSKCTPQHFHQSAIQSFFPDDCFDYRFAVVRHPVERLISEYKYRGIAQGYNLKSSPDQEMPFPKAFNYWVQAVLERYKEDPYLYDNHIRPQHEFLSDGMDVFKLEDGLSDVYQKLSSVLGFEVFPPSKRANVSKRQNVVVDPGTRETIYHFFEKDFEILSYSL